MRRISKTSMAAMADELEKIAGSSSFMRNVATRTKSFVGKKIWEPIKTLPGRTLEAGTLMVAEPIQSMKHGWKATWDPKMGMSGGKLTGALFLGGTALQVPGALSERDITGRGESRLTRSMRVAGGTAAGLAGMRRGILPSVALGIGGDVAAGAVGRKIDKARGYRPKAVQPPDMPAIEPAPRGT